METLSKTWLTPLVVPADTLALRDSTLQCAGSPFGIFSSLHFLYGLHIILQLGHYLR